MPPLLSVRNLKVEIPIGGTFFPAVDGVDFDLHAGEALAIVGELQQARDLMERLLRVASPLGLYAEEFDSSTGRHLGNFPQAFSHLALIEAAARIILPELTEEY